MLSDTIIQILRVKISEMSIIKNCEEKLKYTIKQNIEH